MTGFWCFIDCPHLLEGQAVFEEFKKFALGGNMVDMAVGIVIGAVSYTHLTLPTIYSV